MKRALGLGIATAVAALVCNFWIACTETPQAPSVSFETTGLWRDSDGVYVDTLIGEPFADMPVAFRVFYHYCSECHSVRGHGPKSESARAKITVNTWRDLVAYGPERFVAAAKFGSMPGDSSPQVPPDILASVENYLGTWSSGQLQALAGCRYPTAVIYATKYCGACHTAGGHDFQQARAYHALRLDTYPEWQSYQSLIRGRLTPTHPGGEIMPPRSTSLTMPDENRKALLDWLALGSPNSPDGTGQGDTIPLFPIVIEGAVRGLVYEPMRQIINRSCADCHTRGGKNKDQADAWGHAIQLDTYDQWKAHEKNIRQRIDTAYAMAQDPPLDPMPRYGFANPLSAEERQLILNWLDRGSPNSSDGQ